MTASSALLSTVVDARLAPHAFSAIPAWVWDAGGSRILWANAAGGRLLGVSSLTALRQISLAEDHPTVRDVSRLFSSLPASGGPQLSRLRGLAPFGRPLTCMCSRFETADGSANVLITASEAMDNALHLPARIAYVLDALPATIAFSADGALLHAGASMKERLAGHSSLQAIGADEPARAAIEHGQAYGATALGPMAFERYQAEGMPILLATLDERPAHHADSATANALPQEARPDSEQAVSGNPASMLDEAHKRLVERRHPLRFVWTIDADDRFLIEPGDFTMLAGKPTTAVLERSWADIAHALTLDREGRILRAIAARDTWSGARVDWPAQDTTERLPVLLSGLPVLGHDRSFSGFRGFGVCRDVDRIAIVIAARRAALPEATATTSSPGVATPAPDAVVGGAQARPPQTPRDPRKLTLVPAARNVVPLRAGGGFEKRPTLSAVERSAFQEIARVLAVRTAADAIAQRERDPLEADRSLSPDKPVDRPAPDTPSGDGFDAIAEQLHGRLSRQSEPDLNALAHAALDRVPAAVLLFRADELLFGNALLFEWTGLASLEAVAAAGGVGALFAEPDAVALLSTGGTHALSLRTARREPIRVEVHLTSLPDVDDTVLMLTLTRPSDGERNQQAESALQTALANAGELESILDTATDGVILVDAEGRVLSLNRSAEALFGYESDELVYASFLDLFAPESHRPATDYLEGITRGGVASLLNDGREVIGRARQGGLIPLFMTMGRIADAPVRFCAVLRDITQWKRTEEDLTNARREAERTSSAKSDFLAKISHEIRTPLNAIIGFSEVMMEERFGPIGTERYRGYARDIHTSGEHMISLLNELLDLAKIEAGKLDLTFVKMDLNDVTHQCVAIMQPQANRERIIIRTALSSGLPPVIADTRSVRQIVLNLVSNSIKFTEAGGQVIVSTALTDDGEAVLRVRDTGIGMSEKDLGVALEPFRQLPAAARLSTVGTGLGLPLTKALAEANRAAFRITSAPDAGTLVEIVFPANRVLAE